MNAEAIRAVEDIVLVFVGWLLSILTTELKEYRTKEKEKRKLFTHLWLVLENIYINLEINPVELTPVLTKAGARETAAGGLDMDTDWKRMTPPTPPLLPKDFDVVLDRVMAWESESGQNSFIKQLNSIHSQIELSQQFYKELIVRTKDEDKHIPEKELAQYTELLTDLKSDTFNVLKRTSPLRFPFLQQLKRKMSGRD
jgi:hypothetical protein